jgi:hypothetical protein
VCELFIFDPIFNTSLSILIKLPGSLDLQPKETPGVIRPPRRDIDFLIELAPGAVPSSRIHYRMCTPELVELKIQLKEMMDKGYI